MRLGVESTWWRFRCWRKETVFTGGCPIQEILGLCPWCGLTLFHCGSRHAGENWVSRVGTWVCVLYMLFIRGWHRVWKKTHSAALVHVHVFISTLRPNLRLRIQICSYGGFVELNLLCKDKSTASPASEEAHLKISGLWHMEWCYISPCKIYSVTEYEFTNAHSLKYCT